MKMEMMDLLTEPLVNMERLGDEGDHGTDDDGAVCEHGAAWRRVR